MPLREKWYKQYKTDCSRVYLHSVDHFETSDYSHLNVK